MSYKAHPSGTKSRVIQQASPDITRFLDGSILRQPSSIDLGWKNLVVERRTIVPSDFPELVMDRHFLILWEGHVAVGETAYRGGHFAAYRKVPDTLTVCQPGLRPAIRNRSSHEVIVAALEPEFIASMEEEHEIPSNAPVHDLQGTSDPDLRNLLRLLLSESDAGGPHGGLYTDSLTTALTTRLLFASRLKNLAVKTAASLMPGRVLKRVIDRMRADLGTDLNLSTLASESGFSRAHFLRIFKATTGQTPHRYLSELRLQKARELLFGQSLPLIEIAAACGFSSQAHLSTAFHSRFGAPPSQFRRGQSSARK